MTKARSSAIQGINAITRAAMFLRRISSAPSFRITTSSRTSQKRACFMPHKGIGFGAIRYASGTP